MTQEELEAGADAVARVAERHGMSGYINRDQEREIAAEVIRSYQSLQKPDRNGGLP